MRTWQKTKSQAKNQEQQTAADVHKQAYERALGLLTRREHSALELHHKLTARGFDNAVIDTVLQRLSAENWLSNSRFAEVYAHARADKGYGPLRIRQELRERGIDDDIVNHVLHELEDFWANKLRQLWRKRSRNANPSAYDDRLKQMRFFRQRGYTIDQINELFREAKQ